LLKDIERVNPDFYPQPVRYKSIENSREKHEIVNFEGNFLDKHEFVKVYKKCGGIMHARNPIGRKISYEYYRVNLPIWLEKINNLLKIHEIKLIRHDGLNIIFMENDEGNVIFRPHTRVSS
jgi:hypothetical protein